MTVIMEPCKTVPKYHKLPRASGRRYKKQQLHVCVDCGTAFYVDKITWYSMDGIGTYFEWVQYKGVGDDSNR